ncbi:hypothetical protein C8F01DRAFT_1082744 [Mycena amicta]|nr:hypothetical protein C8F01DRAFT_1082744 [Mycena amicta]
MSSRPAASSSAPKPRAGRRPNAVASGSGASSNPSPAKRRRFQSGSISYSGQPTMSFPPPGVPLPESINHTPFFKVSSPSLFSREFSPLAVSGAVVSPAQAPPVASLSAAKLPMPAFGDKFMGLLYPGDWDNRVDISGLPDEPLRARLQQESIASAAKSADLDMLRDDGPFAKAEHLSAPPPELELPTWVEPIVDFDTGYDKVVGRIPITPHAPSRDDLRGPDGPMMQDDFRNRWLSFEASMNEWRECDRVFRARCIHEQVELPRLAHDEYVALLTARFEEDTRTRSSDVAAIRNSLQDVLSETRNAAIASADCTKSLTRGLQFLVENGHSAPFGDVYVDFANTVLLQRLQSVDPSSGLKFRCFDKSEFVPWSIVYRSDFTTPGSLVYGLDPASVPLVSDSLLRSPPRIVRPPSPLSDVPMDIDIGAPAAAQVLPRVFGHPDGFSHKVSAMKRDTSGVWNFLSDSESVHEEELPPKLCSTSGKVAGRRILSSDSSSSSSGKDVVVVQPVIPVPVLSVRSDWHGNHIDLEPTVDFEELSLPPSPLYSSWTTLVQEGPLPLARFVLLLVRKAHELTFSTRPVSPVNYCLRCVAEEVPCVFAVPGAAGRPSADGRATGSKKAGPPPGGSRCARCRVKRGGCTDAKDVPDSVGRASFSNHFSNLICWLNETLHHDSEKFEGFQASIEACFDEDGSRLPPSAPALPETDDEMQEAIPVPDETPVDLAPIPPPIPLDGDVTRDTSRPHPGPYFSRKGKGLRGTVWQSTLVPAPRLPESLPPFLGRSHPYRRTEIVEEAEPTFRWPDRSYRPPIPSDLFPLPADALAVDVRSDSVAGRYEFGDAAELFKDLEDDKLLDSFRSHAVTMLTRGVAYALGPRLLKVLNQRGLDVDVPRLGATLDGHPLPFPTPLPDISGDLALHTHLCRMAGDEHPFSAFIRAAFETDTMRSYATGKGVFEQSDQVEWEHFAETALFKHLIVNPRKREPPGPSSLSLPSSNANFRVIHLQCQIPSSIFRPWFSTPHFPSLRPSVPAFDDSASDKTVLGQGIDLSGNLDRPAGFTREAGPGPIPACFVLPSWKPSPHCVNLRRVTVRRPAVVDGGDLPRGYRTSNSSDFAPLPLFFPEPLPNKNVENGQGSTDGTTLQRTTTSRWWTGSAVLPGASESNDGEVDVSMEVAEPEVDELNGE